MEDNILLSIFQFPLGSFLVKGKEIIAISHNITKEGVPVFLDLSPCESEAIRTLFESENKPLKRRRIRYFS